MSKEDEQEHSERDRLAWNLPRPRHEVTLAEDLVGSLEGSVSSQANEKAAFSQRPAQSTDEV
jgi:hypothetical protein